MKRKVSYREPRKQKSILVVCDGERTEADYFRNWRSVLGPSRLVIRNELVRSGGNPLRAVRAAIRLKGREGSFHEVWCVCDIDDAPAADIVKAVGLAGRNQITLCMSKRCFEVWIGLHYGKHANHLSCGASAVAHVRKFIPDYAKDLKIAPFRQLFPLTQVALANAAWLRAQDVSDPATDVDYLVQSFVDEARAAGIGLPE
ncbi:RloB family protein [Brevundimonas subvibrioides]|uniref:RloB-like protein n=1 Tax=Brevundimonas subvibrioides (strain ATCC 15264 / DSM 4735 / LMG 14903 / NBRC 16000 / CB 81) TaxID=633149 RepID=D9QN63_BRESC|nr:hypothetical protein Bresu_0951 [Brevundimonas subvibrioides ATCC 15264]